MKALIKKALPLWADQVDDCVCALSCLLSASCSWHMAYVVRSLAIQPDREIRWYVSRSFQNNRSRGPVALVSVVRLMLF
jgi:hypothetical protein